MITTGYEMVLIPVDFLLNYGNFISDREFLAVCHLAAVDEQGKKGWEKVANRLGYTSPKHLENLLRGMEERNLIKINGYDVDVSPLYSMCRNFVPKEVDLFPKPKKQQYHPDTYKILEIMKNVSPHFQQKNVTLRFGQMMIDRGDSLSDIEGCARYLESYYSHKYKDEPVRPKFSIVTAQVVHDSIAKWIAGGRKQEFKESGSLEDLNSILDL